MTSTATTVEQYLAELPEDRRVALTALRSVILENLNPGFEEGIQYGHIGYFVPHSLYPNGYHCDPKQPLPFAGVASQKNHMAFYGFCLYTDPDHMAQFKKEWEATGNKLDMGASCVRFKKIENVPLDVIGNAVRRVTVEKFIAGYEAALPPSKRKK